MCVRAGTLLCLCVGGWSDWLAASCPRVLLSEHTPDTSLRNPQNVPPPPPPPLTLPLFVKPSCCKHRSRYPHMPREYTSTGFIFQTPRSSNCFLRGGAIHRIQGFYFVINASTGKHLLAHSPSPSSSLHLLVPVHPHIQGSGWRKRGWHSVIP